jgi:hypothetical protein
MPSDYCQQPLQLLQAEAGYTKQLAVQLGAATGL